MKEQIRLLITQYVINLRLYIMLSVDESISKAYYDEEDGFGSMAKTLKFAQKYNKDVTLEDVKIGLLRI